MPAVKPRFKRQFRAQTVPQVGTILLSEVGQNVLYGRLNVLLGPLLDGTRTADEREVLSIRRYALVDGRLVAGHSRSRSGDF